MYYVSTDEVTETTAPAAEPLTLTEAKAHLRVSFTDEDAYISSLIVAARQWAEIYLNRAFVERTLRADILGFADTIRLPYRPIIAVDSITYWDTASPSTQQTASSSLYQVSNGIVYRRDGQSWPTPDNRPGSVSITYRAGYASTSSPVDPDENVPTALKHALLLQIAGWYELREDAVVGMTYSTNPAAERLLQAYRNYQ